MSVSDQGLRGHVTKLEILMYLLPNPNSNLTQSNNHLHVFCMLQHCIHGYDLWVFM